jgi:hypothetical protein
MIISDTFERIVFPLGFEFGELLGLSEEWFVPRFSLRRSARFGSGIETRSPLERKDTMTISKIPEYHCVWVRGDVPKLPTSAWQVERHTGSAQQRVERVDCELYINRRKVNLYLSADQQKGNQVCGHTLYAELANSPALDSTVLDCLFENPVLIPETWKRDDLQRICYIFFWGTIYRHLPENILCVRCLCWTGSFWSWRYERLDRFWNDVDPAAMLAN